MEQRELSYRSILEELKPDIVVHGDNWREGLQKPLRQEVLDLLASYGGRLIEFPYASDPKYKTLEERSRAELSLPDSRRGRLKKPDCREYCDSRWWEDVGVRRHVGVQLVRFHSQREAGY